MFQMSYARINSDLAAATCDVHARHNIPLPSRVWVQRAGAYDDAVQSEMKS